jgi:hypothetical protein
MHGLWTMVYPQVTDTVATGELLYLIVFDLNAMGPGVTKGRFRRVTHPVRP